MNEEPEYYWDKHEYQTQYRWRQYTLNDRNDCLGRPVEPCHPRESDNEVRYPIQQRGESDQWSIEED